MHILYILFSSRCHFCLALCSLGPPSCFVVDYHLERGGMPLYDDVGVTVKRAQLLKIKAQVPSIWTKGCVLDNYMCVI